MNTYRYIYPINKKINFKLKEKPYPAYSKEKNYLSDYKHNIRLVYRALCLAYIAGLSDDFQILKNWILSNQTQVEIKNYMHLALENKYILQRAEKNHWQYKINELHLLFQEFNH